jgi:hypothetical protein
MLPLNQLTPYTSLVAFALGMPTMVATYYQAWKARREAAQARAGEIYSKNCLEFVLKNGSSVNLVPLESLHTLPKPGDIVLLPGTGVGAAGGTATGAYRVGRIEHIYARPPEAANGRGIDPKQARLIKAVAHVEGLLEEMERSGAMESEQAMAD